MNEDQLRQALAAADPLRSAPLDVVTSPRALELLETTMDTQTRPPLWRRTSLVVAAAALVLLGGVGAVLADRSGTDTPVPRPTTTVALTVQSGLSSASCLPFDVTILRDMPVALRGTVVDVQPDRVTLDVDRWYKGGDAGRVTVATPDPNSSVSLDGVTFEQGRSFLLTATEGVVNGCGFSGPVSPELEQSYDQAFGTG